LEHKRLAAITGGGPSSFAGMIYGQF